MKRILIDCRFAGGPTGLGRYSREIARGLVRAMPDVRFVFLVRSKTEPWIAPVADAVELFEADIPHYSVREQTALPALIRRSKADLLLSPHFNVPIACPIPFVATIHDVILHRYPNNASLPKRIAYRVLIGSCIRRAKHIIAISEFTKKDIVSFYGSNVAPKITAILQGVDPAYDARPAADIDRVKERLGITRPYFLFVGTAKEHKNVPMLIDAFVASGVTDAELVLVTGGDEAKALKLAPNIRLVPSVADADLPALYSGARAFVTASLYEGFCLPVAEALACGTPVIAANRTATPEAAAGHATLIEPTVDAFAAAFRSPPARSQPVVVGTWEQTAVKTAAVLRAAL